MTVGVPRHPHLPFGRRLRAELLATLQRMVGRRPAPARAAHEGMPAPWARYLQQMTAPVRIPDPPRATVPLHPSPAAAGGIPAAPEVPRASILVVTFEQWSYTDRCLAAVRAFTDPETYELIVVDNGSADETMPRLRTLQSTWPHLRIVSAGRNLGFAAAINAAARRARGERLVVLNNDTVVTPGWLEGLLAVLDADPHTGLVGPVTNDSGDAATVPASYGSLDGLLELARHRAVRHAGRRRELDKLALFCAALRRTAFETVGGLDEQYERGMFEDDDLCRALRTQGYRIVVADDVFVHHAAGTSLRKLSARQYMLTFETNRWRFERKWSVRWKPTVTPGRTRSRKQPRIRPRPRPSGSDRP